MYTPPKGSSSSEGQAQRNPFVDLRATAAREEGEKSRERARNKRRDRARSPKFGLHAGYVW